MADLWKEYTRVAKKKYVEWKWKTLKFVHNYRLLEQVHNWREAMEHKLSNLHNEV